MIFTMDRFLLTAIAIASVLHHRGPIFEAQHQEPNTKAQHKGSASD